MVERGSGEYLHPGQTPYMTGAYTREPKQTFKHARQQLGEPPQTLIDVGCAGGEFIHYLSTEMPSTKFTGIDVTAAFVASACKLNIPSADFRVGNLVDAEGKFSAVTCLGTLPVFNDIEDPLLSLLRLCAAGGIIVADGFFNEDDMDVRISFRHNNGSGADETWHVGFNHFSRAHVRDFLARHGAIDVRFSEVPFLVDINRDASAHPNTARAYTFKDEFGRRRLTNSLGLLLNTTMMVIRLP